MIRYFDLNQFLTIGPNTWSYHLFGNGRRKILAFHGYGDNGQQFEPIGRAMGEEAQIIAIDLPWHGKTQWKSNSFSQTDINDLIESLKQKCEFDGFDLMGFSFGGRVCLKMYSYWCTDLGALWLLAPDGLHTRHMKIVDNLPSFLEKKLIKGMEMRSSYLESAISISKKLGLLNNFQYRFAKAHLADPRKRIRAVGFWKSMADFQLDRKALSYSLARFEGKIYFFYGNKDTITSPDAGQQLAKKLTNSSYYKLDGSHWIIGPVAEFLKKSNLQDVLY